MLVAIAGAADAAGIDDQTAVAQSHAAGEMGVGAEDEGLRDALCELLDTIQRRYRDRAVGVHRVEPVDLVIVRRRVTKQDLIAKHARRRLGAQPVEMRGIELRMRGTVPRPHLLRGTVEQIAVVIAEHVHGIELHQDLDGPPRVERPAQHVAEIDDVGNALSADVGEHRLQREVVSVDVGNRGKTHC